MPSPRYIHPDEIKLDSVLSLVLHAQEGQKNGVDYFHDQYADLFPGELVKLEWQLFEDGLIHYCVGPNGLIIEITEEGLAFFSYGGYGGGLRIPQKRKSPYRRSRAGVWNWILALGFLMCLIFAFVLKNNKG